ncbi:MAG: hypothetical protein WCK21_05025, partial [Actinomycetota bacterium]
RVDKGRVAKMAAALGVKGAVQELAADQGGGWQVGSADSTAASLMVSHDGLLSWWFNPDPSLTGSSIGCAVSASTTEAPATTIGGEISARPDATVTTTVPVAPPECPAPTPPAGVPTNDAAQASAQKLFAQLGYAVSKYQFETYADEWGANVTAFLMIDGHRSPLTASVGFGAEGAITWASGSLATPEKAGEYPLVGTKSGIDRLRDGSWMGYYGSPGIMTAVGTRANTITETAVASGNSNSGNSNSGSAAVPPLGTVPVDQPVCVPAADCVPETYLPPEPITVHLNAAHLDLTMVWDVDGTVWLLPAYTFVAVDGGTFTVIAIDSQFIDLPAPGRSPEPTPAAPTP